MLLGCCGVGSLYAAVVGAVCSLVPCLWGFRGCCIAGGVQSRPINGTVRFSAPINGLCRPAPSMWWTLNSRGRGAGVQCCFFMVAAVCSATLFLVVDLCSGTWLPLIFDVCISA